MGRKTRKCLSTLNHPRWRKELRDWLEEATLFPWPCGCRPSFAWSSVRARRVAVGDLGSASRTNPAEMTFVSQCAKKFQPRKSDFSIEHILNVAGKKQNFTSLEFPKEDVDQKNKFEWLNCTRYRPPKLPRQGKREGIRRRNLGRNPRIPFSSSQVAFLEAKFSRTPYLSSSDVTTLASHLKLSETRVKIWFQNRRARERRERETKSKEDISVQSGERGESLPRSLTIPPSIPQCFSLEYRNPFKYIAYNETVDYLSTVAPVDLTDRKDPTGRQSVCRFNRTEI